MTYEFEGKTEKEAIDKAAETLGLDKSEFDIEILETQRSGLFKKGFVKILVHADVVIDLGQTTNDNEKQYQAEREKASSGAVFGNPEPADEFESSLLQFITDVLEKMGYSATVSVLFREEKKLGIKIDSDHSSIIIGKKGKNLDALQLLANIFAGRLGQPETRIILDSENYRIRREEALVRLAYTVADKVRETKGDMLLEPMNPFERRLIHTTLNDISDVDTKSEGEGLYKQVRVFFKGLRR